MTFFGIPSIIRIATKNKFLDQPGDRRVHFVSTPSLGGIGIFAGTVFSIIMWTPLDEFSGLQYILSAFFIIFLVGAKDDIDPISVHKKLIGQILAAAIIIFLADIRITSLYGMFEIGVLPYSYSVVITFSFVLLVINSFNFIDGINGLAGSLGIVMAVTFGTWFFLIGRIEMAAIAFALTGAITAFLYYNYTPAKIFMGDTGSLLLGLIVAILCINFMEAQQWISARHPYAYDSPIGVALGIIFIPIFDAIRVLLMRLLRGQAPYKADRSHIHHLLLRIGFSHMQATSILVFCNVLFMGLVFQYQHIGNLQLMTMLFSLALLLTALLYVIFMARKEMLSQHRSR